MPQQFILASKLLILTTQQDIMADYADILTASPDILTDKQLILISSPDIITAQPDIITSADGILASYVLIPTRNLFILVKNACIVQLIPNGFQDEGFIKMNNFCLRRDEKVKDSRVTLQLFWQCIRQKETFLSLILMFFWYKPYKKREAA